MAILVVKFIKIRKHPVQIEGVDYFPEDAAKTFAEIKANKEGKALPVKKHQTTAVSGIENEEDDNNGDSGEEADSDDEE